MKYILTSLLAVIVLQAALSQSKSPLVFTIQMNSTAQPIRNFGASGCWFSEEIGTKWPEDKKKLVAALLFSRDFDSDGKPKGIGLSAFRYNIGAGTTEQGDSSGIRDPAHRVECFLLPDGTYDWNKQKGYTWMLQQAKNYGVTDLIAFVNSPPVQFTQNRKGFKFIKDSSGNLREDKYEAYANFLAEVMKHFDTINLHFNYISPVNEPQWDWTGTMGTAKQEGSPWTNEEISRVAKAVNTSLSSQKLTTKILLTEAGMLDHLFTANLPHRSTQIDNLWNPNSALYIGGLSHATKFVEGHGYFSENGNTNMINTRRSIRDTLIKYNGLEYWQSEYSMLGNGYRDGKTGQLSPMDHAMWLAKVIHTDLTIGNATAWHYWNSYEPGNANSPRYFLIAMNPRRATNRDTLYTVTKNLWALGHYSLFIRPGMYRVETGRNDGLADTAVAQQIMIAAFKDAQEKKLVVNMINYTTEDKDVSLVLEGITKGKPLRLVKRYVTSAKEGDDMKPYPINDDKGKGATKDSNHNDVSLPARSITTFIFST
jgi:O-glycosyl hydrolase